MTVEEKKAIQTVLLDELAAHTEDQPTLLIDALLSEQGFQFVYQVLGRRLGMANDQSAHVRASPEGDAAGAEREGRGGVNVLRTDGRRRDLGGTLGGIGDIVSAASYQRPKLKDASGMELRLRQLAQAQLLGGGQETLGGHGALQPDGADPHVAVAGHELRPGDLRRRGSSLGGVGDTSTGGGSAGGSSPAQSYQTALGNYQQQQALQQQMTP